MLTPYAPLPFFASSGRRSQSIMGLLLLLASFTLCAGLSGTFLQLTDLVSARSELYGRD